MKNLKVVFFGTPHFVIPVLENLLKEYSLIGVVTAPDKKVGREQTLTSSPVKLWASQNTRNTMTIEKFDETIIETLKELTPDLFIVAAYGKIIPLSVLEIPKYGALNIHPSLLPKYRGASPIQAAILNGDKVSGVTIIKMDEKMDHGPVIIQKEIELLETDTFEKLSNRMFEEASELLIKIIPNFITGEITPKEQNHAIASYCNLIKKNDGYFDINKPPSAEILDRMIRAYYPWPTAWTKWSFGDNQEKVVKFYPEEKVQIEGKKIISFEEFSRGYSNFPLSYPRLG